jgi:hypothetical protein
VTRRRNKPRLRRLPLSWVLVVIGTAVATFSATLVGSQLLRGEAGKERGASQATARHQSSDGSPHPVAGNFEPDDTRLTECGSGDQRCYEQAFGNLAYYRGPEAALSLFDRKVQADSAIEAGCHRTVHSIGSAALARFRGNVARAFVHGSASCGSGYYHGILERSLIDASSREEMARITREICSDPVVRRREFIAYQCVHGLGHGLMINSGYQLPVSLKICDELLTAWDRNSCYGGVFMENISSSYGVRSTWLRDDDLLYPCNAVARRYKEYCYLIVTSRVLEANGYDWQTTARTCETAERGWIDICFQSLGRDASGVTRFDVRRIRELCALAGSSEGECLYGAARDMTNHFAGPQRSTELCTDAPAEFAARCFYGIGTIVGGLNPTSEERRAVCVSTTTKHFLSCLRGTGEEASPGDMPEA